MQMDTTALYEFGHDMIKQYDMLNDAHSTLQDMKCRTLLEYHNRALLEQGKVFEMQNRLDIMGEVAKRCPAFAKSPILARLGVELPS
jgi:hypothetical protein